MLPNYFSLVLRSVAQLNPNTRATRQAFFERTRHTVEHHLRTRTPSLSNEEIAANIEALEAAFERIEEEHKDLSTIKSLPRIQASKIAEPGSPLATPSRGHSASKVIAATGFVAVLFAGGLVFLPRLVAAYQLFWGRDIVKALLYDELGFDDAVADAASIGFAFFYALAWVPLLAWTWKALAWKFSSRQLAIAFASWVLIYGHAPLARGLLGADVCFNQRTGQPQKWYVVQNGGAVLLSDTAGYDTDLGQQRQPVTQEICDIRTRQRKGNQTKRIEDVTKTTDFFDAKGNPKLWYYRSASDQFEFFDAPGFHPESRELLLPISREIVARLEEERTSNRVGAAKWEERNRRRLDAFLKTCSSVAPTETRIIVVATQLAPHQTSDLDLRRFVSGVSGLAIIPYDKLIEGLDKKQLKFYDTIWSGAEDRGAQFLMVQFRNSATDDGWEAVEQSDASLGLVALDKKIIPKKTMMRVMLLSDLAVVDIPKSNPEPIELRALGKRTAASDWASVGVGANGQCSLYVITLLDVD